MKPMLLITGMSRIGKSHLLHALLARAGGRFSLLDTTFDHEQFDAPEPFDCDALFVDHITTLLGARNAALDDAAAWCKAYGKPLCLAVQSRELAARYVDIPAGSVELRLAERSDQVHLSVIRESETLSFALGAHCSEAATDELLHHAVRALEQLGVASFGTALGVADDAPTGI